MTSETSEDAAFSAAFDDDIQPTTDEAPETGTEPTGQVEEPQEAEATADAPVEPAEAEAPPQESPVPNVPLDQWKGYLDEREKRQEAQQRAEALERQLQFLTQTQTQPNTPKTPDVFEDPEGFQRHQHSQMQQAMMQTKSEMSWFMAEREFGAETVKQADAWVRQQPSAVFQQLASAPSPYHAAVEAMKRERAAAVLKEYDYDIDKLLAARAPQQQPSMTQQSASAPAIPPSVTPSGTLGAAPTQSEDAIFRAVFS